MKKLISMVMAAAMVVSLVPATAFAANTATFKVVNDQEYTEDEAADVKKDNKADKTDPVNPVEAVVKGPEIQLKLKDVDSKKGVKDNFDITLDFNNAELKDDIVKATLDENGNVTAGTVVGGVVGKSAIKVYVKDAAEDGDDTVKLIVQEDVNGTQTVVDLEDDDVITINVDALKLVLTKASKGTKATVEVSGDFGDSDALTFATVLDSGIKATLKKVAEVAEEETTELEKELKIETTVGYFADNQEIELKLNTGFEWDMNTTKLNALIAGVDGIDGAVVNKDNDVLTLTVQGAKVDTITIAKNLLSIDAADAKVGAVAKLTVKALADKAVPGSFKATADAVEAAKVVGDKVTMSVDEDEDVPVIYSGVNVDNYGITDDSDHEALEVTLKESVKEALDAKKSFTLTLPEGVYATDVDVNVETLGNIAGGATDIENIFKAAYEKGEQETFEFKRKAFADSDDAFEFNFTMTLIAEPTFEGDVKLTLGGDAFDDEQEVTIAKFVKPYTIEAQQNDLVIDYRNTKVPTNVVVKEAEAGLWAKDEMEFVFDIEKMEFEDDVTLTVDDKSGMEVKSIKGTDMGFKVTDESDDDPATVTISDISLYMSRDIAAGAYDLELLTSAGEAMYTTDSLFTTEDDCAAGADNYKVADYKDWKYTTKTTKVNDRDVTTYTFDVEADTVKEGFVNVITAGRDQDDASFTKKVVVPVGEKYLIAGEEQVALDVPAYISAAGYTMLPVRAVATALGINNNNVLWNQASRTVTILYGQRIITMVAGQKVVTVNGNTIPASATVQIKDGRTFLPMRDLATALGVTDITWDAATKTATMNGNQNK